ncbi:kelch-like protein 10 [Anabrus simplex]|uniref:kelch-like protein 10 n=1 Tax=Anabrus simplex TaxID=316456 RepID=UPI0035A37307
MDYPTYCHRPSRNRPSNGTSNINKGNPNKSKKSLCSCKRCICAPENRSYYRVPKSWRVLRKEHLLCDGIINCSDGEKVLVHRVLMCAVSPYFKTAFTSCLNQESNGKTEVNVTIPRRILETILDFAYTGKCDVTWENVRELLPAAEKYDVNGVIQQCSSFLMKELRPENCLSVIRFARPYFCSNLEMKAKRYVCYYIRSILQYRHGFEELTAQELEGILSDDELNVKEEEMVFDAIMKWVDVNPEARKHNLRELLHCPRYALMNFHYFSEVVMKNRYILENKSCSVALMLANMESEKVRHIGHLDSTDLLCRPRVPYEILFAVGGWSGGSPTNFMETYDVRADRWFLSADNDSTPRAYHGICVLNNLIYIIGGFDGDENFNSMRSFDPLTHFWSERACMNEPRCYVSVCVHDGHIYAMGGYNGHTRLNTAEQYSPDLNQWEMIAPMNIHRSDASAAVVRDKIYIAGGYDGRDVLSSAEMYDPVTDQWTLIMPMINPRSGVTLLSYEDCLYALGGFNGYARLGSGEKLDPIRLDGWHEISDMVTPRSNFGAAVLDDMIFVVGGFDGSRPISLVESYNPKTNEWTIVKDMNLSRSALGCCVMAGLPNARGYSFLSKFDSKSFSDFVLGERDGNTSDISLSDAEDDTTFTIQDEGGEGNDSDSEADLSASDPITTKIQDSVGRRRPFWKKALNFPPEHKETPPMLLTCHNMNITNEMRDAGSSTMTAMDCCRLEIPLRCAFTACPSGMTTSASTTNENHKKEILLSVLPLAQRPR